MCGIFGMWSEHEVKRGLLDAMASALRHRGPDDYGTYLKPGIGLGNARLSIIDLASGRQPIANEDGTIWVVFNGEIYNYPELRRNLAGRGHQFKTRSDTEVLVHLYEEHGSDFVGKLRGMFAFAIWDETKRRLLLARDHLGQKPLYYRHGHGEFAFASEIKALFEDRRVTPHLNEAAMHQLMSLRYLPGSETLFKGICKLPAGQMLILTDGAISTRPYWDLCYEPKLPGSEADLVAELRQRLLVAVECHLLSDVPVGAFLSGGIDSSLLAAMMCTVSGEPTRTFSVGVRAASFNELPYARLVADRYQTHHHELLVEENLVSALPEMIWHMEEPVDPFAFGVYTVAALASRHVKVVLGGDGGDELFAGYDRYLGNQLVDLYCLLPRGIRRRVIEPLLLRLPDNYSYNNRVQKLRWLMAMSHSSAGERYAQSASFLRFGQAHKQALYTGQLWRQLGDTDTAGDLLSFFEASNASDPIDRMLYADTKTRLPDHLLMIADRMTMAHSLEARSPYVDYQVAEFVAALPARLKLRGRTLKYIQRQVAREFLPEALIHRPKQGFSFPLAYWFKEKLRPLAELTFRDSRLAAEGYFQQPAMLALLDEHVNGGVDHNYRLWLLLNLELWYRMFVDQQPQHEIQARLEDHVGAATQAGLSPASKSAVSLAAQGTTRPAT
jgi:asparagine synthase (glutamine-hydrolysing)